ncbi:helix-turn-helix domain-containing protein [Rhodococcus sp. H29-C3]|uniref:TetR/AcrR family transcriptional regulator n=1 Tax=Rhodococcus sp. H29-C3 TaxID=3046307 RepID=UPI0024BACCDD|nr:helix-turn-helix domain-containing protein [Rhodococcus sp. H29-C3]MDJ0362711.1 helix-turn-helix domain-containing protein [Rhodococcus sp. H29-C3]
MPAPSTREELLDAAERLIAERGLAGVSVREVIRAAGQRNNGAVDYYFGSWHALLIELWSRRATSDAVVRELHTAAEDAQDRLGALVEAYVRPFVTEIAACSPSYWARFNEQWLAGIRSDFVASPQPLMPDDSTYPPIPGLENLQRLLMDIATELRHLPTGDRPARVALAARFVVSALASWERDRVAGVWRDLDAFETELCALMLALLLTGSHAH